MHTCYSMRGVSSCTCTSLPHLQLSSRTGVVTCVAWFSTPSGCSIAVRVAPSHSPYVPYSAQTRTAEDKGTGFPKKCTGKRCYKFRG